MKHININPKEDLIFTNKVREMCKSCKRYGKKATCPPYLDNIDYYKDLLKSYNKGILYYDKFNSKDKQNWKKLGRDSSIKIHKKLLKERDKLFNKGIYFAAIFGAGSCKLCEKCSFPCRFTNKSVAPFEGTGVDVVKLMSKYNIKIKFPIQLSYYRIGAIFYD